MDVQDTIMLDAEDSEDAAAVQEESCSNEKNLDIEMVDAFLMASPPMSSTTFLLLPASSCSSSSDCSDAEIISVSSTYNKLLESEKSEEAGDSESRESRSTELLLQVAAPAVAAVAESYDLSCCCAAIPRAAAAPYKRFLAPKQLRADPRAVSGAAATEPDLLHLPESPRSCDHQQVEENNCTGKSGSVAARVWSSEKLLLRSDAGGCGLCRLLERAEIQLNKLKNVCGIRSSMTRRCCKCSDSPQELQEEVQQQQVGRLRLMRSSSSSAHDDHKLGLTILNELKDDSAKLKLLVSALDNSLNKLGILQQQLQEDDDDDDVVADGSEKTKREEGSLQGAAAAAAISTVVPPPPTQDHDQQPPKNTLTNGTSTITQDSISSSCNNVADEEEEAPTSSSPAAAGNLEDSDELDNVCCSICSHQRSSEDSCTKRVTCIVATAGGHHMESNKIQSLNYLQAVNA